MEFVYALSRDNARTPMQWDDTKNAGFSDGKPWIRLNPNYETINVAKQINDKNSILNYYRELIRLRKEKDVIVYGSYDLILEKDEEIFAFTRTLRDEKLLVICNFTENQSLFILPENLRDYSREHIIGNYPLDDRLASEFYLQPYETQVLLLK